MQIDGKNLALTYLLGIAAFILAGGAILLLSSPQLLGILVAVIILMVPPGFYFYRNPRGLKDALLFSAIFGFTITPIYLVVFLFPVSIIEGFFMGFPDYQSILAKADMAQVAVELLTSGFLFTVISVCSYSVTNSIRPRHTPDKSPKNRRNKNQS